jgi:uncharacterized hydrophobic protein (TIGR00271 family)
VRDIDEGVLSLLSVVTNAFCYQHWQGGVIVVSCQLSTATEPNSHKVHTNSDRSDVEYTDGKRAAIHDSVASGAALNGSYLAMNLASALIAGFGLMENSPAVIIGAMLIAMLYGPIVGIALGLAEADLGLLSRSLVTEVVGAALVVVAGLTIGLSTRDLIIGSEIISRTSPSLVDLLIALVGGLAGGFSFVAKGLSGVVVGVAIATALVPPLTTGGILLARQLPTEAGGAFLLFLANFTAIVMGAMIVFLFAGYRPPSASPARKVLLPRLLFLALLLVLAVRLNGVLRSVSAQSIFQTNIRKALAPEVAKIPGARLVEVSIDQRNGKTTVLAVARTPQPLSSEQVARLNDLACKVAGRDIGLIVRSVITAETTRYGNVYEPNLHTSEDANPD